MHKRKTFRTKYSETKKKDQPTEQNDGNDLEDYKHSWPFLSFIPSFSSQSSLTVTERATTQNLKRKTEFRSFFFFVAYMEKLLIKKYYYDAASSTYVIDSFNDRLNNRLTVICLLACISVIVGSLYIGKPINCWTPGLLLLFLIIEKPTNTLIFLFKLNSKDSTIATQTIFVG